MTLKQFFQLAGGVLVALIVSKTNLPLFIKGPIIILSVTTGILLAFVPINGRPFSQWIVAFIKAVYSPTEFYWSVNPATESDNLAMPNGQSTSTFKPSHSSTLDRFEEQLFSRFAQLFSGQTININAQKSLDTEPVSLRTDSVDVPPAPRATQTFVSTMEQVAPPTPPISNVQHSTSNTIPPSTVQTQVPISNVRNLVSNIQPARPTPIPVLDRSVKTPTVTPTLANLPLPSLPNILVGQVANTSGQIIEGVIIEIAEAESGIPVRALRSNKLGQFQMATPLLPGKYVITAEKDGLVFDPIAVLVDNKIVNPILITAKG